MVEKASSGCEAAVEFTGTIEGRTTQWSCEHRDWKLPLVFGRTPTITRDLADSFAAGPRPAARGATVRKAVPKLMPPVRPLPDTGGFVGIALLYCVLAQNKMCTEREGRRLGVGVDFVRG